MMDELGNQTVRVIKRVRLKRGVMSDVTDAEFPGCSVQPVTSTDGVPIAKSQKWVIYAPLGFPESNENVLAVDGIGERLHVDGDLQTWFDDDGIADHVWGHLVKWKGAGNG
ncbi:hypothetical protein [Rhodococcus qingshengii]|uniref:hypothetical protein n=2 Tax=Rhodococcus qingshengii TaxID=334542 RepID=UPI00287FB1EA|nr:hypothetical protein [Rhodococcus qingshengii]